MGVVGGFPLGMAISMAATYVGGGKSTSREQDMSFLSNFFFVWCFRMLQFRSTVLLSISWFLQELAQLADFVELIL